MRIGFTLIELLIVIAIIAILALIAIPNFLEAQVRAKVTKVYADMRSVATAMESYYVDYNSYPIQLSEYRGSSPHRAFAFQVNRLTGLTTPVQYLATTRGDVMSDPFSQARDVNARAYSYVNILGAFQYLQDPSAPWQAGALRNVLVAPAPLKFNGSESRIYLCNWAVTSPGPDRIEGDPQLDNPSLTREPKQLITNPGDACWKAHMNGQLYFYDPTNGTASRGNIWRIGPSSPNK